MQGTALQGQNSVSYLSMLKLCTSPGLFKLLLFVLCLILLCWWLNPSAFTARSQATLPSYPYPNATIRLEKGSRQAHYRCSGALDTVLQKLVNPVRRPGPSWYPYNPDDIWLFVTHGARKVKAMRSIPGPLIT